MGCETKCTYCFSLSLFSQKHGASHRREFPNNSSRLQNSVSDEEDDEEEMEGEESEKRLGERERGGAVPVEGESETEREGEVSPVTERSSFCLWLLTYILFLCIYIVQLLSYAFVYTHAYLHKHIPAYIHTHVPAYTHTHIHVPAFIHTYILSCSLLKRKLKGLY